MSPMSRATQTMVAGNGTSRQIFEAVQTVHIAAQDGERTDELAHPRVIPVVALPVNAASS
jgi:hypothetical protein